MHGNVQIARVLYSVFIRFLGIVKIVHCGTLGSLCSQMRVHVYAAEIFLRHLAVSAADDTSAVHRPKLGSLFCNKVCFNARCLDVMDLRMDRKPADDYST